MQAISYNEGGAPISSGPAPVLRDRSRSETRSVLLVEDDPGDAKLVELCARGQGITVDVVTDLHGAKQRLQRESYDAVLLDLRLPDGEQLEVVDAILPIVGATAVVALTGLDDEELAHRCLDRGVQDYVRKADLSPEVLSRALDHAVVRRRAVELRRRLDLSEHEASLGRLAGALAHELNNQLTPLLVNMEQATRRVDAARSAVPGASAETLRELLDDMMERLEVEHDGLWRIASLVREMQGVLRGAREGRPTEPVDLDDVVRRTLRLAKNALVQVAALNVELGGCDPVLADRDKLVQVVLNLLNNAAEAIDDNSDREARITVGTAGRGAMVALFVADTGVGITPAQKERLFEPFFSSKVRGRSTGLGLAVCADIVARFGGRIEVDDEPGGGSRFTVLLPRCTARGGQTTPPSAEPSDGATRRRVLLIDDDPSVRAAIRASVRRHHDITLAASGAEALALLEGDRNFDVVICDMMMPGMDGVAVFEAVRALDPTLLQRVILLSGGAFTERAQRFLDEVDRPVLGKPCSREELLATIEAVANGAVSR